jgi:hypothetical protein
VINREGTAMDSKIVVMIVQLAMPNGDGSYEVKPMADVETCIAAAEIEASDPFVADVLCSELDGGKLELNFKPRDKARRSPETSNFKSTG